MLIGTHWFAAVTSLWAQKQMIDQGTKINKRHCYFKKVLHKPPPPEHQHNMVNSMCICIYV